MTMDVKTVESTIIEELIEKTEKRINKPVLGFYKKKGLEAYDNIKTYNWVIQFDEKAIGSISVVRISDKCEYAELGYCLGYSYWNKGFMSEAAKAVIDYLFSEIGVNRVGISHAVENPGSGKVAQKCGMTYEGTKREYFKTSTGKFVDIADYGILRSEWKINK